MSWSLGSILIIVKAQMTYKQRHSTDVINIESSEMMSQRADAARAHKRWHPLLVLIGGPRYLVLSTCYDLRCTRLLYQLIGDTRQVVYECNLSFKDQLS